MSYLKKNMTILMADDDEDDCWMARETFKNVNLSNELYTVGDGEELLDYLHHRGKYSDPDQSPRPGLILLDLNMPRKNGLEALKEIKSDPTISQIPVIVLTSSKTEEDILRTYHLGVNSFIVKPFKVEGLVDIVKTISKDWLHIIDAPFTKSPCTT